MQSLIFSYLSLAGSTVLLLEHNRLGRIGVRNRDPHFKIRALSFHNKSDEDRIVKAGGLLTLHSLVSV